MRIVLHVHPPFSARPRITNGGLPTELLINTSKELCNA